MTANHIQRSRKADRVRLILEVREAYRRLADLSQRRRGSSPSLRAAFANAIRRLSAMNRALALVALELAVRHWDWK